MRCIGALEAGGTKMVCGIYDEQGKLLKEQTFPTRPPAETMPVIENFFKQHEICTLGIGSFGPIEMNADSEKYGTILNTPKTAWRDYPIFKVLRDRLDIPIGLDTDVNAAAIAEQQMGAGQGCSSLAYVTVGTGIGVGICVDGQAVHGKYHPEAGHMRVTVHEMDKDFQGVCPYHGNCLEGLAAGPALRARTGMDAKNLSDDDSVFDLLSYYLAQLCVNLILTFSPEKIVIGGGVLQREMLYSRIRMQTLQLLNDYISSEIIRNQIDDFIAAPRLYPVSGLYGAYLLGKKALIEHRG